MIYLKYFESKNYNNVIFCDIHGVLVIPEKGDKISYDKHRHIKYNPNHEWDKNSSKLLKKLMDETHSILIVTSTLKWKEDLNYIKNLGRKRDIKISGVTPNIEKCEKGLEIKEWIKDNYVNNFVIIDDNTLDIKSDFPNNFVETKH